MTQNTSTAVMARRAEPADSLDFFPTPPWATRALMEWIGQNYLLPMSTSHVLEPAAGAGHMARVLAERFDFVFARDVHDYGYPLQKLSDFTIEPLDLKPDWIITNPPFQLAEPFIERSLVSGAAVAMLVRTSFLEGAGRYARIFSRCPPTHVLQFSERVPMLRGRCLRDASTATAYCWLVWEWLRFNPTRSARLEWIGPCRKRLERPGDYDDDAEGLGS